MDATRGRGAEGLADWARPMLRQPEVMQAMLDPCIADQARALQVAVLCEVAEACLRANPRERCVVIVGVGWQGQRAREMGAGQGPWGRFRGPGGRSRSRGAGPGGPGAGGQGGMAGGCRGAGPGAGGLGGRARLVSAQAELVGAGLAGEMMRRVSGL